jgi:DNA-binding MarR family transcriptional regulator
LTTQTHGAVLAWVRLLGAHGALTRAFTAELQVEHGITLSDFEALRLLSEAPNRRMRRVDLAAGIGLTPSGITRLLDGLQDSGLVRKESCEADARVTYACLTDEGRRVLRGAADTITAAIDSLVAERYSAEELETLLGLLARLPGGAAEEAECAGGEGGVRDGEQG